MSDRDTETITAELRVLAAYRAACAADCRPVRSTRSVDALLDELRGAYVVDHTPPGG